MAVAQLEFHQERTGSGYVVDLMMKIAHNIIGTLGVGESSFYTYKDDCRGRRRMLRQETGAVGQRREARRGPV